MRISLIFLSVLLAVLIGVFLYTWYRLHESFDLHVSANIQNIHKYPLTHSVQYFTAQDGIKIASWYVPVKNPKAVVILVHPYDTAFGGKTVMLPLAQYLSAQGYSTLLVDLRSFGDSQGNKVSFGVNEWKDLSAAYDYVKSLPENKNVKVGFLGQSMGAATAIDAVGLTGKGDFVIASVPFANFKSLFAYQVQKEGLPEFIFLPMVRLSAFLELGIQYEHYTPASQVQRVHVPILFIQALQDGEINKDDVVYLYNLANKPKEIWVANAPHDVYDAAPTAFQQHILMFLSQYAK